MSPISNSYHLKLGFAGAAHTGGPHPMGHAIYVVDDATSSNTHTDSDNSEYASGTFVVPNGVTYISAVCVGGGGGASASHNGRDLDGDDWPSDYGAAHSSIPRTSYATSPPTIGYHPAGGSGGGGGGLAFGTFAVTPGETLTIRVGFGGTGGDLFKPQGNRAYPGCGQHGGSSKIIRGSTVLLEGGGGKAGLQWPYSGSTYGSYGNATTQGDGHGGPGGSTGGTEREGGQTGGAGGKGADGDEGGGGGGAGGYSTGTDPANHVGLGSGGFESSSYQDGWDSSFGGGSGGGSARWNITTGVNTPQHHSNGGGGVGVYMAYRHYNGQYRTVNEGGERGFPGKGGSTYTRAGVNDISLGEYGGFSGYINLGGEDGKNNGSSGWTNGEGGKAGQFGGGGGGASDYAHTNTITVGQTGGHGANGIVRIIFGGNPTTGVETGRFFPDFNTTFMSE